MWPLVLVGGRFCSPQKDFVYVFKVMAKGCVVSCSVILIRLAFHQLLAF